MTTAAAAEHELRREIDTGELAKGEVDLEVRASPAERAALARRFGIASLDRLEATVRARRLGRGVYGVRGRLSADVTQNCVVTLAPVVASLDEGFRLTWSPDIGWADDGEAPNEVEIEVEIEVEGARPAGGEGFTIDVGEAVAQQLALALDPYPRAPGVEVPALADGEALEGDGRRPFAALAQLRRRRD